MGEALSEEQLKELVLITSEKLNIEYPAIIEKDYYVTQVIHLLGKIENEYFQLVFGGGTCLAKAHKVVKRMSEDVDFKIQSNVKNWSSSKSQLLKTLKKFRLQIESVLNASNLTLSEKITENEGRHSSFELNYPALFPTHNALLRPHLQLDFTLSNAQLLIESLNVNTLIEDTLGIPILFSSKPIDCLSINETAIEKWASLTRRIVAIEDNYCNNDKTLIRHLYDLVTLNGANKLDENFFKLSKSTIESDAKQFKNQHPEYFNHPTKEILRSLNILKNSTNWKKRYQEFVDSMVYDKTNVPDYEIAIQWLESISKKVVSTFAS